MVVVVESFVLLLCLKFFTQKCFIQNVLSFCSLSMRASRFHENWSVGPDVLVRKAMHMYAHYF
jgi:hypothetical protein